MFVKNNKAHTPKATKEKCVKRLNWILKNFEKNQEHFSVERKKKIKDRTYELKFKDINLEIWFDIMKTIQVFKKKYEKCS